MTSAALDCPPATAARAPTASLADLVRHGFLPGQARLYDRFGRPFEYLRVSVTDLCNLRCVYCMPEEGVPWLPHAEILSFEELAAVVEAAAACGVWKVRLTGGEPLVRKDIARLVERVAKIPGIRDLSMTTNGVLLAPLARDLVQAGLRRINVSLDTLDPVKFRRIARRGDLGSVLAGIDQAQSSGLAPVKVNTVVMGGVNDGEAAALAALSLDRAIDVRFIEYMPLLEGKDCVRSPAAFQFVSGQATRERIEARFGPLVPEETGDAARGPAEMWRIPGAAGRVGFISAMSAPFCKRCDRLRLAANGELRSCLLDGGTVDLKSILRTRGDRGSIIHAMARALWLKPETHRRWDAVSSGRMSRIGG